MSDLLTTEQEKRLTEQMNRTIEEMRALHQREVAELKKSAGATLSAEVRESLDRMTQAANENEAKLRASQKANDEAALRLEQKAAAFEAEQKQKRQETEAFINREILRLKGFGHSGEGGPAPGDHLERKAYGRYLRHGMEALTSDERKALAERKVLSVGNDVTGGYLAPPQYEAEIIKAIVDVSPIREFVRQRQSSASELMIPVRTRTSAAVRRGESATQGETQNPTWGLLRIPVPEMTVQTRVTTQNLEDSAFDLEAVLMADFAEQFAKLEGAEFVSGTGVGEMLGILSANAGGPGVPVAYTPSGYAATIAGAAAGSAGAADGLVNTMHALKGGYANAGRWIMNMSSLGKIRLLKDANGQFLWQPSFGGLQAANQSTILGAPYTVCPDMPDEGANTFAVAFGDWMRAYSIVDHPGITLLRDPFTLQDDGQVKFTARKRTGGKPTLVEAARLMKCAAT